MATVSQVARRAGVSPTAIRNWSAEFADYLSPAANPPKGEQRNYNEDDLSVFVTIAAMRAQHATTEDIHAALVDGQRLEPLPGVDDDQDDEDAPQAPRQALQVLQERVTALDLRNADLTAQLVDAERRAAAAEAKLELLQGKPDEPTRSEPMTFRQWWNQRRG